jgi:hypothetical protein
MGKESEKSRVKNDSFKKLIPYFESILKECPEEGIIIQGNAFIGKTEKGKGGIFLRMRFEILKGELRKEKKQPVK